MKKISRALRYNKKVEREGGGGVPPGTILFSRSEFFFGFPAKPEIFGDLESYFGRFSL